MRGRRMETFFVFSFILIKCQFVQTANEVKFVKFEKLPDKDFPTECAIQAMSNSYAGVDVDYETGKCTAKLHTSQPLDAPNSSFLKKKSCIVSYKGGQFTNLTSNSTSWTFPGQFGVGAKFEVILKLPMESTWSKFFLFIRAPRLHGSTVCLNKEERLIFLGCTDDDTNMRYTENFEAGKVYSIEFRAGEDSVLIYIDSHLMQEVNNCPPPETVTRFEYFYNPNEPVADIIMLIFQGL